jgi:hypothetical protein
VKTIGFDGRVAREDLNLVEASPRLAKLIDYIFSKPEMALFQNRVGTARPSLLGGHCAGALSVFFLE